MQYQHKNREELSVKKIAHSDRQWVILALTLVVVVGGVWRLGGFEFEDFGGVIADRGIGILLDFF